MRLGRVLCAWAVLLVGLGAPALGAQAVLPASAFVETAPLGASLRLDGKPLTVRTPVLLRGLKPGAHQLVVFKTGYFPVTIDLVVDPKRVGQTKLVLQPDSVVAAFPSEPYFDVGAFRQPTRGQQFRLPSGRYDLGTVNPAVSAKPVFAEEALSTVATWLGWGLFAAATTTTAVDAYLVTTAQKSWSAATPTLWGAWVADVAWGWALGERRTRFEQSVAPSLEPLVQDAEFPTSLAERAETLQQAGDLDGAEAAYTQLVKAYPEADEAPGAWFHLARIHAARGERALATGEYRLVAEVYQASQWYDRARKALADLAFAEGETTEALYHLRQMVLADGFFDPAEVAADIDRLAASQEAPDAP